MVVLDIVLVPDEVLHTKAKPVTDFGPKLQQLIDDMVETMRDAPGVGLAGPQVDQLLRVIVVEFGDEEDEEIPPTLYTLVNPEISKMSKETVFGFEGCLSIPDLLGNVERAESVTIKAQDRHGKVVKIKASGWLARIFQHEIDHTNGILFTDRTDEVYELEEILAAQERAEAGGAIDEIDQPPLSV
ncbi:MAG: peptide deformylase [Anaerolineales bacterium]|nr:peptide deformylase [Anaerolineales bacterium]